MSFKIVYFILFTQLISYAELRYILDSEALDYTKPLQKSNQDRRSINNRPKSTLSTQSPSGSQLPLQLSLPCSSSSYTVYTTLIEL